MRTGAGVLGISSTDAPRVFVSHATPDADFANRLSDDLRRLGADVWLDSSHMGTGDFVARINAALSTRDLVVLVLSPTAIQSPWVNQEVNAAITREKQGIMRPMIVVVAQPCTPSTIPPLWTVYHRYDATKGYEAAVAGVAKELGLNSARSQKSSPQAPVATVSPSAPYQAINLQRVAGAAAAGFAAFVAGLLLVLDHRGISLPFVDSHLYYAPYINQYPVLALVDVALSVVLARTEILTRWQLQGHRPRHPWILALSALATITVPLGVLVFLGVWDPLHVGLGSSTARDWINGIALGVMTLTFVPTCMAVGVLATVSGQQWWWRVELIAILATVLFFGLIITTAATGGSAPPLLIGLTCASGISSLYICVLFGLIGSPSKG